VFALPLYAHHSHGNYLMTEYTILKGTIKEIHWLNPHSWIYMEVKDDKGEVAVWALEGASVAQLRRRGWTADSLKVGDTISVRCHQLRDKSNGCLLGFITPPGGTEKIFD
jgi:hypothetical protein